MEPGSGALRPSTYRTDPSGATPSPARPQTPDPLLPYVGLDTPNLCVSRGCVDGSGPSCVCRLGPFASGPGKEVGRRVCGFTTFFFPLGPLPLLRSSPARVTSGESFYGPPTTPVVLSVLDLYSDVPVCPDVARKVMDFPTLRRPGRVLRQLPVLSHLVTSLCPRCLV